MGGGEEYLNDYCICCIDVGVRNLGIAALVCDSETFKFKKIVGIDLIDITTFPHHGDPKLCKLNHGKTFCDWIEHVFVYYDIVFSKVDKILIERQPPSGFVVVEQLIYSRYREKSELISPVSVHKFLNLRNFNYDERKNRVVKIAKELITDPKILKEFNMFPRNHDIADAISFGLFWLVMKHKKYLEDENFRRKMENIYISQNVIPRGVLFNYWFDKYKYEK